ncbi:MAG TPA: hypothetical protein VGD31_17175 [Sphingobacteriaceae bacterium]
MELRDLIVTPILIIIVFVVAYVVRPYVTDGITRRYFLPALALRILGALALGFIYQYYYDGGDTYNYHTHGSRHMWDAFMDSPGKGFQIFWHGSSDLTGVYQYASRIVFLDDPGSFMIVRLAFLGDILTFSSYSATAVLFSIFSFIGMWMFFLTFYNKYPHLHRRLAIAAFFIPSAFFWGSGLLKDTVTLGCLGIAVYAADQIFIRSRVNPIKFTLLILSLILLYKIKVYILMALLPAAIVWIFLSRIQSIRYTVVKFVLFPVALVLSIGLGFFAMIRTGASSEKYSIDNIARTAQITAYDIRYYTGKDAGSGYSIGELDGTWQSMVRLAPAAVNATLFRPYLWEVKNPLMLLAALEAFLFLIGVLYIVFTTRSALFRGLRNPDVLFMLMFSLTFAFAVGVSTFNFGTLVRYKIPLLPFFGVMLTLMLDYSKSLRKLPALDWTE